MSDFNDYISRSDAQAAIPENLYQDLVQGVSKASAALALGHRVPMEVLTQYLPAVSSLPTAFWNVPDSTPSSLTQTTDMAMSLNTIIAYELSSITVIPNNVIDDSRINLWDVVKPRVAESMAKVLDNAVVWGVGRPSGSNPSVLETIAANSGGRLSRTAAVVSGTTHVADTSAASGDTGLPVYGPGIPSGTTVSSVSAGVSLTLSAAATASNSNGVLIAPSGAFVLPADIGASGHDSAADLLLAAQSIGEAGYSPTAAFVSGGWQWRNMAARTQQLVANPVGNDAVPLILGGLPISPFVGANRGDGSMGGTGVVWNALADSIVGDWTQLKVGVRKDVTMDTFNSGVVSDSAGAVQYNLMQANATALRTTARYSWVIIAPPVADDSYTGTRSGFASVINSGAHSLPVGVARPEVDPHARTPLTLPAVPVDFVGDPSGSMGATGPRSGRAKR